jgi:hypothetical protein
MNPTGETWATPPAPPVPPLRPPPPDPREIAAELERDRARPPLDLLLRRPEVLLERLDGPNAGKTLWILLAAAVIGHAAYGVVVASFAGGDQWWASPTKVVLGTLLSGAICFPSLYIFAVLSGANVGLRHVVGLCLAVTASTAVFLAGFGPVAWIFTQSSNSVAPLAPIHLILWAISLVTSKRILNAGMSHWKARRGALFGLWITIFLVTGLQMMTTLRPILGPSERFFDPTRKFFLEHWSETLDPRPKGR